MKVIVIGASRGIGLEFVRQYRAAGASVTASARDDAGLARLKGLGATALGLDVADAASAADLSSQIEGSAFDISTLDEPWPSKKKDEQDAKQSEDSQSKAEKPTHNELLIRTRERREEIALHRDGLGQKLEVPLRLGEKISDAGQAAGDAVSKAAGQARHLADTASEKVSEGVERATDKLASLSGFEGENAKEALRERWRPLAIMAGSMAMFVVFLRKLLRK